MATLNLGRLKPVFRSTWNNATAYSVDDIVVRNNQSYISIQAGTNQDPATATAYWTLMAAAGTDLSSSLTTQGDIAVKGTGTTISRLPIGSANQILQVNSSANGLEYTAKPEGGLVQTVYATNTTAYQTGGTTYGTGSLVLVSGSITPTSASNKIIILAEADGSVNNSNSQGTSRDSFFQISRDISGGTSGTQIVETSQRLEEDSFDYAQVKASVVTMDTTYNTTSQLTYNYQTKGEGGGWDSFWQQNGGASNMILMEVKV